MNSIAKLAIGSVLGLAGTFVAGGIFLPSQVEMVAWQTVAAPHEHMSALVATPESWLDWSHWRSRVRADSPTQVGGPKTGAGATWDFGQGEEAVSVSITSFEPAQRVSYELFIQPYRNPFRGVVEFYNRGRTTKVKWTVSTDVGERWLLRWAGLIAPGFYKGRYKQQVLRLGVVAEEREHEAMQEALAAEEDALKKRRAKD